MTGSASSPSFALGLKMMEGLPTTHQVEGMFSLQTILHHHIVL